MGASLHTRMRTFLDAVEAHDISFSEEIQGSAISRENRGLYLLDSQGLIQIVVNFVPPGITVNANHYTALLSDQLYLEIQRKRPGRLQQGIIFHQDNAPPEQGSNCRDGL